MRRAAGLAAFALGALALASAGAVLAQGAEEPTAEIVRADLPGRVLFEHNCAPCHGTGPGDDRSAMLPGTTKLTEKYEGALPGALELRDNLPAPVLRAFVRQGTGAMPPFRASELSDADIDAIADYLAATAALNAPASGD